MTIPNFKTAHASFPSSAARPDGMRRSTGPDAVPVKEMAASAQHGLPALSLEDMQNATEIARLLALPFPAFAQAVARLLETLGYANVQAMKAMHGRGKGRNQHGGYDLRMFLPTHLTRGLVIAQVKQYREAVPRSFVDELRGTMLRLGASQGLLVTTGTFSASAIEAAQAAQYAAPVRLMDGQELARLVRAHPGLLETDGEPVTVPVRAVPVPPAVSPLQPGIPQESERAESRSLDGQGAPPDRPAAFSPSATSPQKGQEGVTLALRVHICLASVQPILKDVKEHGGTAGERRRP